MSTIINIPTVNTRVWDTALLQWKSAEQATLEANSVEVTLAGVATAANQATGNTSLATIAGAIAGTEIQADVLTLPAITGTVTANAGTNLNTSALATQTTLASILTDLQAKADLVETQPVSGPLTDTQLRATAVPISGTTLTVFQEDDVTSTAPGGTQTVTATAGADPITTLDTV